MNDDKIVLSIGAFVFNKGEILLLKAPKWEDRYVVPSGKVKFMEPVEDAVKREVLEETGLQIKNLEFLNFIEFINPPQYYKDNFHGVGLQYKCQSFNRDVRLNSEATNYLWTPLGMASGLNLEEGTREALDLLVRKTL